MVVAWSGIVAFWEYIQNTFMHKKLDLQFHLANGLATALEFKMAAEILKTVLVRFVQKLKTQQVTSTVKSFRNVLLNLQAVLLLSKLVRLPKQK